MYNKGIIIIHWITAILVLLLFILGKYMEDMELIQKTGLIRVHILLGMLVLFLTLIRTWLYFKRKRPARLKTSSNFHDKVIKWIHNGFYFLLYGITLSGISVAIQGSYREALIRDNPGASIAKDLPSLLVHNLISMLIILFFVLHVVGFIIHLIKTQENTLKRIL